MSENCKLDLFMAGGLNHLLVKYFGGQENNCFSRLRATFGLPFVSIALSVLADTHRGRMYIRAVCLGVLKAYL